MLATKAKRPFILVAGADFTPESDFALDQAARIASRIEGGELHVVHAAEVGTSEAHLTQLAGQLEAYLSEMTAALGIPLVRVTIHVRTGDPARRIAAFAAMLDADTIVVGARRVRHIKDLFTGSVGDRVLRLATCPVLVASPKPEDRAVHDPAVEPACSDCLSVRALSADTQMWCSRHAERHVHGNRYTYRRELPFAQHDSAVTPTGVGQ